MGTSAVESAAPATATTAPAPAEMSETKKALASLPEEMRQQITLNRMKNAVAAQIRGTMWGKDLSPEAVRAVAEYARENNLDAVRHLEILGGRIYLKADLYEERGAPLIQAGLIRKDAPDYINVDDRLEKLAKAGDTWAQDEVTRRLRERIRWNAPESATAIVVQRLWIRGVEEPVVGVNWCGGGSRKGDPVGDSEPTKTAASRAARRAWKQIVEVVPHYGHQFTAIREGIEVANEVLVEQDRVVALQAEAERPRAIAAPADGAYGLNDEPAAQPVAQPAAASTSDDGFPF